MHSFVRAVRLRASFVILTVGLFVSVIGWRYAASADQDAVQRELIGRTRVLSETFAARLQDLVSPLKALADFVAAEPGLKPAEFERFADYVAPGHPSALWLGWVPLVRDADRAQFEQEAAAASPGFHIVDPGGNGRIGIAESRDEYLPLLAVRSSRAARPPLGIDLAQTTATARAMKQARDLGHAIAYQPLAPISGGLDTVAVVEPIFHRGSAAPADVAGRRSSLRGFTIALYSTEMVRDYITAGVVRANERISFARQGISVDPAGVRDAADVDPIRLQIAGDAFRVARPVFFLGQRWMRLFCSGRMRSPHCALSRRSAGWAADCC